MKPVHYFFLTILLLLVVIIAAKNRNKIKDFFSKPKNNIPANGTPCATGGFVGGNNGTYQNGVCVPKTNPIIIINTDGQACITSDNHAGVMKGGVCIAIKPIEGSACTTSSGKAGTIKNGVCVANTVIPAEGSACTSVNGKPGIIKNGVCVETTTLPDGTACLTSNGQVGTIKNGLCDQTYTIEGQACKMPNGNSGIIKKGICIENLPDGTACTTSGGLPGTIKTGICIANPIDGSPCVTSSGKPGTLKNGVCVETVVSSKIEVINPMGAQQYYKHKSQGGDWLFDMINAAPAPLGTQFNKLNTGPWKNFYVVGTPELYETDNKADGADAGFYLVDDFKTV